MKIQCKTCQKVHVDDKWTENCATQNSSSYTYCPQCFDEFMKTPLNMPTALAAR